MDAHTQDGAAEIRSQMMRFAAVSVAGGLLDYVTAAILIRIGMLDIAALAIGITLAGGLSFVAHEIWTFRTAGAPQPHGRILRWTLLVVVSLGLRALIFRWAESAGAEERMEFLHRDPATTHAIAQLAALAVAFIASSAVNYLVSRFIVFSRKA